MLVSLNFIGSLLSIPNVRYLLYLPSKISENGEESQSVELIIYFNCEQFITNWIHLELPLTPIIFSHLKAYQNLMQITSHCSTISFTNSYDFNFASSSWTIVTIIYSSA